MADVAAAHFTVVSDPRISREALIELRRLVDAAVSSRTSQIGCGGDGERSKNAATESSDIDGDHKPLPQEIEVKALELLEQLLLAVIPAIDGGRRDEQDHE
jgi:hypothetical protein